jgi:hypothetical protein
MVRKARAGRAAAADASPEGRDVTASEAAGYAYCAKAWHLQHVLGARPSAAAAARRAEGTARHRAHGSRVAALSRAAPRLRRSVAALLALAAVLLVLAVLMGGGGR